jgi:hypothetical protein
VGVNAGVFILIHMRRGKTKMNQEVNYVSKIEEENEGK